MALVLCMARGSRGGTLAASTGGSAVSAFAYDLDGSYGTSVVPLAHWDASDMNGNGDANSGWPTDGTGTVSGTSRWIDRTGNYSLVQNGATNQGFYIDSAINSKPAVRSTDDESMKLLVNNAAGDTTAEITADAGGYHIYHVAKVTVDGTANFYGIHGRLWANSDDSFLVDRRVAGSAVNKMSLYNDTHFTLADFYNKDAWYEVRSYDDGGTNKALIKYHIDGASAATTAGQASDDGMDAEFLGYSVWTFNPKEDVAETIFFGEALSSDDRAQVEAYLDNKYAIADS